MRDDLLISFPRFFSTVLKFRAKKCLKSFDASLSIQVLTQVNKSQKVHLMCLLSRIFLSGDILTASWSDFVN